MQNVMELRRQLANVDWLLTQLGLPLEERVPGGRYTRCPWHNDEGRANLVVSLHPDGTIGVKCFSCQQGGDALSLIGQVFSLRFPAACAKAVELLGGGAVPPPPRRPPEKTYPPANQVQLLWESALLLHSALAAQEVLRARGMDPGRLGELVRGLGPGCCYPDWAHQKGTTWGASGYQVLLPLWSPWGVMASLHARRFGRAGDERKGVCPTRYTQRGLVFANAAGRKLLAQGEAEGAALLVCEGAPDFLVLASHFRRAVLGVMSGSWSDEIAARVPEGCAVVVWTHTDGQKDRAGKPLPGAGQRYAAKIAQSLSPRCRVRVVKQARPEYGKAPDINDVLLQGGSAAVVRMIGEAPLWPVERVVLVCGGRAYADAACVEKVLDELHHDRPLTLLVHGAATGADTLAAAWATRRQVKQRPAAGPLRNAAMLEETRPELVVAFPGGRGTADLVARARAAGVPVLEVSGD